MAGEVMVGGKMFCEVAQRTGRDGVANRVAAIYEIIDAFAEMGQPRQSATPAAKGRREKAAAVKLSRSLSEYRAE